MHITSRMRAAKHDETVTQRRANSKNVIGACDRRGGDISGRSTGGVLSRQQHCPVSQQEAYPAQLEAMLRARHYDGRVANAGVSGDTTWGMLNRLETAVRAGTRVVILQPGAMMSGME
jgi:hypothetical protein